MLAEARPSWPHIAGIFLLDLLSSPLGLLAPLPLKIAVDSAIDGRPLPPIVAWALPHSLSASRSGAVAVSALLLIAVAVARQLQNVAGTLLAAYTGERLALGFRARLFGHVQRLSLAYHDLTGTSDSTYRIQYDATSIQYLPIDGLIPFITAGLTLAGMLVVTLKIDWQLALVALVVAPVLYVVSQRWRNRLRVQTREVKTFESLALGVVQETLSALRVVKAFGREEYEERRYRDSSAHGMRARIRLGLVGGAFDLSVGLITALGTAGVLWLGVQHVRSGILTTGELLLLMAYLAQLYEPLRTIGKKSGSLQGYLTSAERAFAVLDRAPDVVEQANARSLGRAAGEIEWRHVSFAYETGQPVLNDVSFQVPAGTRVGIAGRTGAGKTTILSLLTRFYDPDSGQILLDGVDVRQYKLADLRNQFAIVLQDPVLFSTSIAENIAYGRPDASQEEIVLAARLADVHDFIVSLPDGYETRVGERGMRLSGGERQRISLARAFLKDAPILLLDEPTSSVDMKTESTIMEAIERLMRGRTTFIVAHRLSTLSNCQIRLEVQDGRVLPKEEAVLSPPLDRRTPSRAIDGVVATDVLGHQPLAALRRIDSSAEEPQRVLVLKPEKKRSSVYRLEGVGPGGSAVVAKRGRSDRIATEVLIYQEVLPFVPAATLKCYGWIDDQQRGFSWLFLEDAGEERLSASGEHRKLAGRWLALLHTSIRCQSRLQACLPTRDVDYYREIGGLAYEAIARSLSNSAFNASDVATLESILRCCHRLEASWSEVEAICRALPYTLVHGDFGAKNVRVRGGPDGPNLLPLDWDSAGWGVAASDLSQVDVTAYWSIAIARWPALELAVLVKLATVGRMFLALESITGERDTLRSDWVNGVMRKMRAYESEMANALQAAGWASR